MENRKNYFMLLWCGVNPNMISLNGKTRSELNHLFFKTSKIPDNVVFEENFYSLILSNKIGFWYLNFFFCKFIFMIKWR